MFPLYKHFHAAQPDHGPFVSAQRAFCSVVSALHVYQHPPASQQDTLPKTMPSTCQAFKTLHNAANHDIAPPKTLRTMQDTGRQCLSKPHAPERSRSHEGISCISGDVYCIYSIKVCVYVCLLYGEWSEWSCVKLIPGGALYDRKEVREERLPT